MENATLTANVRGMNDLPHNMSCFPLVEPSSEHHETKQAHARHGPLQNHDVVVRVVLPVQEFNYLRNAGALIGHECQSPWGGVWDGQAKRKNIRCLDESAFSDLHEYKMLEMENSD